MGKRLVLVDGSSYLYRAFHALPPLTNSHGEPTGAVYGVANMLRKLRKDHASDYFAVVFDAKGKTFREELYPEYKAHRPPMPSDLVMQIQPLHALIQAMGLPLLMEEGVEADDVIGTLTTEATKQGIDVVVSTGDKDFAQLVNTHVRLINTMSGAELNRGGVIEKFGVPPERIVDYLALMGDSVDNIPGVPKCGPKTAAKWLQQYDSLDNLAAHADEIKGKIGENLRGALDKLPLSRTLATIKTDVELKHSIQDLVIQPENTQLLTNLVARLEFKSWLRELLSSQPKQDSSAVGTVGTATAAVAYELILTEADFEKWLKKLHKAEIFAFDTETTSLSAIDAELVGVSFAINENSGAYVPVGHKYAGAPQQLDLQYVLNGLKPLLQARDQLKVLHNLKYDFNVLNNYAIEIQTPFMDTMLESYLIDPSGSRHDLDTLALKYLGKNNIKYEDVTGRGAKQIGFAEVPLEQAGPYAAEDADVCLQLHTLFVKKFDNLPGQKKVLQEIELPLVPVLARMERAGFLISKQQLDIQAKELNKRLIKVREEIYILAGEEFNIDSPKQLQVILFEKLGLPVTTKTPTGQPSTAESVLSDLALQYDLPARIVEYRSLTKLLSTYIEKLPQQINPRTGRVHTSFHQAITATGRLSSSDPNLQNIPIRTEEGRRIREAFIAAPGAVILAADYSQIELRIMAHLSADPGLLKAFSEGMDVHRYTASEVFSVKPEEVTPDQRRGAKAINFGLIYGMSAFGLSRQLGISRQEAEAYVARYFERYPGVKVYMDTTRAFAREHGYVETIFGRRLYLPEIKASAHPRRMAAERAAINAPMQGTAADIIKLAMIAVDHALIKSGSKAKLILQVHDELILEVPQPELAMVQPMLVDCMTHAVKLRVPLEVGVGSGPHWGAAH